MRIALAAVWGFAEATLFFIVPDVLLTWIAVKRGWREAIAAALLATAGVAMGGALMYHWAHGDAEAARAAVERVPAVSAAMMESVRRALGEGGLAAMFKGAFTGTPYKAYAVEAGAAGSGLAPFLAATVGARMLRFAIAILAAASAARVLESRLHPRTLGRALAGWWIAFYAGFFWLMPS
jgi:membrane protein YqaA with SNARE-associated domain